MGEPDLRASDRDRETVAEILREHAGEGRLDPEELDERLTAAYAARTRGDLERLTTDLPQRTPPAPRKPWFPPHLVPAAVKLALIDVLCVVIWLTSGADGTFWPGIVIAATAVSLAGRWARESSSAGHTSDRPRDRGRPQGRGHRS